MKVQLSAENDLKQKSLKSSSRSKRWVSLS